jgi:PAS domain S-box-containing protein
MGEQSLTRSGIADMDATDRSQILHILQERRETIIDRWYRAIAWTGFTSLNAADMRQYLLGLTDQIIGCLLSEPFDRHQAQGIGTSLARLHYYAQAETLSRTLEVLACQLTENMSSQQSSALQNAIALLLGALSAGFFSQARDTILAEQEQIRNALFAERNRAVEALRISEERYRWLVELSPDGIGVYSEDRLVYINTAGARMVGATSADELIGRPVIGFVHPEYLRLVEERRELLAADTAVPAIEEKFVRLDGSTLDVEVSAIPSTYQGKPAVQFVVRDITARKRAEMERLAQVRKSLS